MDMSSYLQNDKVGEDAMADVDSDSTDCCDVGIWSEEGSDAEDCIGDDASAREEGCAPHSSETEDGGMPLDEEEHNFTEQPASEGGELECSGADEAVCEDGHSMEVPSAPVAEQAPARRRADGLTGSNSSDESNVSMRRWYSWCSAPLPARTESQRTTKVASGSRRSSSLSSKSSSCSSTSGEKVASSSLLVKFLLSNDKYTPIHVKLEVLDVRSQVCLGTFRKVAPANVNDFIIASLPIENVQDAEFISESWSFGLGDPDAVQSKGIRYSLPFNGAARHVCQSFGHPSLPPLMLALLTPWTLAGGKYSHRGQLHNSVDFDMPVGHQVRACRSGIVIATKNDSDEGGASKKYSGSANFVQILHSDHTVGCYLHFLKGGVTARVGAKVRRGQVIGFIGMTGFTSRPHVHFHVKRCGDFHDGREWTTVPFLFKGPTSQGLVLNAG
ncbi:hypothetical protein GUITHDRAFT_140931 [Guillardia theta CCMP2712]|uniref:M23ase beta-sheet core domain-containing protein n=1 Tax=Guillardia theta (strain CCMP2712) TaxID=905079 RepID=L1J2Q0_GUITC|nr:hypothetical protein GUITHDRAFT_140931 [Guillardia theta CCMP2712]EKX42771.1 hypothetical protein GUITHDRAFT_140931 [Guillardia theta CCMP2712]|eukprot:XP_005829751.1 hypothetical protein GUITHDRAFT_140931 [Guillardia theta CCMP2712]